MQWSRVGSPEHDFQYAIRDKIDGFWHHAPYAFRPISDAHSELVSKYLEVCELARVFAASFVDDFRTGEN